MLRIVFLLGFSRVISGNIRQPYEINEVLSGKFASKTWNGTWISGDEFIYKDHNGNFLVYNLQDNKIDYFLDKSVLEKYQGVSIIPSKDNLYILLQYNISSVFRHSEIALYTIYDRRNGIYFDLHEKQTISFAIWSPIGHSLVYVYENNIYYLDTPESFQNPVKLTSSGKTGVIYNGITDWVYEEEVFPSNIALWFSPNGRKLAFASFNDKKVHDYYYLLYGTPGALQDQYPKVESLKYPKVGTSNPCVELFIVNLETIKVVPIKVNAIPPRFQPDNYVLYDVIWVNDDEISVIYTNRVQNQAELIRCNIHSCLQEAYYVCDRGWLNAEIPKYNKQGNKRIEILPEPEENDFFNHLVLTDIKANTRQRLTRGKFNVASILGWDENNNLLYYEASIENLPTQNHIFVLEFNYFTIKCLSCNIKTSRGFCKYATASFSLDLSNFAITCLGPDPHFVQIYNVFKLNETVIWETNHELIKKLTNKLQPLTKDFKITLPEGFQAYVRLYFPPDFDKTKKYPTIVYVYAGPDSTLIRDVYSPSITNYFVTNMKYIYVLIDGRGSNNQGQNKLFQIYRRLGSVEVDDQIYVMKCLQENLPFIDADRTGIWGWSYGGFAATSALIKDVDNVFKCGLAVAPVTNFIYYDSIYTERYMGLPTEEDNLFGYNNTDLSRNVEGLRNKSFFLIHGNADDNVHYQQSMILSKALETADIQFGQQSYPDENHSIGNRLQHLFHTIDRFWSRCFGLLDLPAPKLEIT